MEPGTSIRLSPRGRRAVALIAVSLLAIAAAGLAWVGPGLRLGTPANSKNTAARPAPPTVAPLRSTVYSFVSGSLGWANVDTLSGESTVFKTEDGGKHWRRLTTLVGAWTQAIQFLDRDHGFVVTDNPGRVYRTKDGGAHWDPIATFEADAIDITFADVRHGWMLARPSDLKQPSSIFATTDAGDSWTHMSNGPPGSYGLVFRGSEAWLSSQGFEAGPIRVYASFDGGSSWSGTEVPRPPASKANAANSPFFRTRISALPGAGVVVLVETGAVCQIKDGSCGAYALAEFTSFDRGSTWKYVPRPPGEYVDVGYADPFHWWSANGSGTLFMSPDNGQTWNPTPAALPPGRHTFYILDPLHAWVQVFTGVSSGADPNQVLGYVSTLLSTADGGLRWVKVSTPQLS